MLSDHRAPNFRCLSFQNNTASDAVPSDSKIWKSVPVFHVHLRQGGMKIGAQFVFMCAILFALMRMSDGLPVSHAVQLVLEDGTSRTLGIGHDEAIAVMKMNKLVREQGFAMREASDGYSFSPCEVEDDCNGERVCVDPKGIGNGRVSECTNCSYTCMCLQTATAYCSNCHECELYSKDDINSTRETCASNPGAPIGLCVSKNLIKDGILVEFGCNDFPDASFIPYLNPTPFFTPHFTPYFTPEFQGPCMVVKNNDTEDEPEENDTNESDPVDDAIEPGYESGISDGKSCIETRMLLNESGLSVSSLVYTQDRRASILCDNFGTCTTPGHMIVYKSRPMTMRTYCSLSQDVLSTHSCTNQVRFVNSPKFTPRSRFKSRTPQLLLTPFAATFETNLESAFLQIAIKLGLWPFCVSYLGLGSPVFRPLLKTQSTALCVNRAHAIQQYEWAHFILQSFSDTFYTWVSSISYTVPWQFVHTINLKLLKCFWQKDVYY